MADRKILPLDEAQDEIEWLRGRVEYLELALVDHLGQRSDVRREEEAGQREQDDE